MAAENLFLSEQHPRSRRWAIVEDDGSVAWMYLTAPDSERPVADCWLYNRVEAPTRFDATRGAPPVVPASHLVSSTPFPAPAPDAVSFVWSGDGESVAVLFDADPVGSILAGEARGYSAHLSRPGPFGAPLDPARFEQVFGARAEPE